MSSFPKTGFHDWPEYHPGRLALAQTATTVLTSLSGSWHPSTGVRLLGDQRYYKYLHQISLAVNAHTRFQWFQNNGVDYDASYIRVPPNNNPVTDVNSGDMACNVNGNTGKPNRATVAAGSTFTAEFHHEARSSQGIDPSHKGATIAYLAKVGDARTASASGLQWFKIHQDGGINPWASDKFNSNGGKWSFTIPQKIANGDYLLRAETISLHSAGSYPGAQLYFGCAQITVTGGTGGSPATVSFPGAYKGSDPGITFQLYYPVPTSYKVPGPAVYTG